MSSDSSLSVCLHKWRPHEWVLGPQEFLGAHFEFLGRSAPEGCCGKLWAALPWGGWERQEWRPNLRGASTLVEGSQRERPGQSGLEVRYWCAHHTGSLGKILWWAALRCGLGLGPALPLSLEFFQSISEHPTSFPMVGFGLLNSEYFFC